jgi:hypothetical protein
VVRFADPAVHRAQASQSRRTGLPRKLANKIAADGKTHGKTANESRHGEKLSSASSECNAMPLQPALGRPSLLLRAASSCATAAPW